MGGEDSSARQSQDIAAAQCRGMDSRAHLASIHSVQENAYVLSYLVSQVLRNNTGSAIRPFFSCRDQFWDIMT